jgi:hypothetical protein
LELYRLTNNLDGKNKHKNNRKSKKESGGKSKSEKKRKLDWKTMNSEYLAALCHRAVLKQNVNPVDAQFSSRQLLNTQNYAK